MFSRLRISQKLALLVTTAILAFVITQIFAFFAQERNAERLQDVEQQLYPTLELTTENLGQLELMEAQINSAVTTGDEAQLEDTRAYYDEIRDNLDELGRLAPGLADRVHRLEDDLETYYDNAVRIATAFIEGDGDFRELGQDASENAERLRDLSERMRELRSETRADFTDSISDTQTLTEQSAAANLTITVIAIIALVVLSLLIGRSITNSLGRVVTSLRDMAHGDGDLTSRIEYDGRDELGDLVTHFNAFVAKLHDSFATISQEVEGLRNVSQQLSSASQQNLERITDQSTAIASARHSVDELVKSVEEVAGFASDASEQTQDAAEFAGKGKNHVSSNVRTIEDLANDVEETARLVNDFETHSARVAGLLDTIKTVTEQTNLLALNAAIEAARAGEHGRGFAVVADEVRDLAVRTQKSAEEIETVIGELSNLSESSVKAMQASVEKAHNGLSSTKESGEMLEKILSNVENISSINEQIAAATHEQSATFSEVVNNFSDIHNDAEQVMDSSRELDRVSTESQDISKRLHEVSSQFRV